VLTTTAACVLEPAACLNAAGRDRRTPRSLVDRDEYGPITGRPGGLFTATAVALALDARDELGRIATWVPDGDLL
jgi:hypothetical protein